MCRDLKNKLAKLQELLQVTGKVAIAFSGGVDSTLLLRVACDTLGPENVTALQAVSCLIPEQDQLKTRKLVAAPENGIRCSYQIVPVQPLLWPEFVVNSERRCYFCKKRIYGALYVAMRQGDHPSSTTESSSRFVYLLDGTNTDDLQEHRPGLQAIQELSVGTPLALAGLDKKDIRSLAKQLGLANWNQPSNSCLATRIPVHQQITKVLLEHIEQAEAFLREKGFIGCRVKPGHHTVEVQVMTDDLERFSAEFLRPEITQYLATLGFNSIFLNPRGRD